MGTKILVVDDSVFMRRIVRNVLYLGGFQDVIEAENGESALCKFETEKPDLVLLDVVMPGLDGIEVLKRVMNMDENAKVIMLSAVGQKKTIEVCNEFGSVGYIIKPFDKEQLLSVVEEALLAKEKRKAFEKLTELEEDALREIGNIGAQHAATALSKIVGQSVKAKLVEAKIASFTDFPKLLGNREALVSGVYLPVTGDVSGSLLLIFPEESALKIVSMMLKKKEKLTELDEMGKSALSEAGNIIAGNCLTALSDQLAITLVEHVPDFAQGMVGALIDNVAVVFGQKAEKALIMQVKLYTETKIKIEAYFFLIFALAETREMLRVIRAKVGA